ncbi:DNA topoisomerase 2-like isoform X1 [Tripterygium wilfordii]|uniref:DNA topoisomerase 2 n=1 Tax=Tripterygium wilfordii TaxID=458696 RepID=A0A7J7E214_TRIWF|nr:DNA topoisomerase 2-like isoform X2 [Tripterygium wilfordii]KAF5752648.1 DNA topoisomerase 2-like isoform X1 [Tripterygium wilfordii]
MPAEKKLPLQTSNNVNTAGAPQKTIEETYQKKTQLEHILLRPDTYIGSIEKHTQTLWIYENDEIVHRSVSYVPGLYKIFDEILVNAADNKQRDPKMDSLKVVIDVEQNFISVYNNGDGVPVEIHQEEGVYVPELIFGHLLTSSNYDDNVKKTTGGRNGYGAKLTNIFSTEFVIETADGKRQKKYKQVFANNMGKKSDPVINKCKEGENWTKVSFKPDLSKFNMSHLEDDVVALMRKRVFDMAGCLGKTVKVELNGSRVPIKSFIDYVDLYLRSASKFRQDPLPRIVEKVNDRWEVCVSLSEGQFQQVSFVNGIATIKGGTHVDYVTNQITNHVMATVNKKNKNANVKAHTVKNHLWVFVNALIDNPAFDSQTKETLTLRQSSFGSKCELSDELMKKVIKSGIVESLLSWADFKQSKELKKTDGTKTQKIQVEKLEDANDAGGRNSDKCTLILTEGDSAKALAMAGLSIVGRDHYGVFPLRGKLLNVREATHTQIMNNKEIENIKRILGLQQNKQYDSIKSLRYGHLMIMTDQDHDGSHIKGLLINFIHSFWPSLLKIPSFLVEFITPIVKATHKNGTVLSFYSMPEYESWKESFGGSASGWSIKYYKGLGTSTSKEGKEYFGNLGMHKKDFVWQDEQDGEAIELAFSKKKIEARKQWLRQLEPGTHLDQKEKLIKYSDFVNKELILFSMADLQRSIPSMVDGLKPGQRKILFCSFKRNFVKEAKVAQFSGYVSEHSAYHHGEQSLASTIIGMAQNYVGSNNINLFQPNGQFGTRNMGGKDHASARYLYTQLSPITRFLFPRDDDRLLNYLSEDGQTIEPSWYMPIIPMVLVNGSEGIGTGWSSYIPNYNPAEIVANVRRLLKGEMMEPMHPWYKGFTGSIEKTASKEAGSTYTISGRIEEVNETMLRVIELPVRRWTQDYKEFLQSISEGNNKAINPFITEFREHSDDTTVEFGIILSKENMLLAKQEGLVKKFKLTTTISTSNMHLFDSNGVIKKYDTPEQILEEFFPLRLEFYEKRKKILLDNLEMELLKLENRVRFILGVVSGEIIVNNRKRADLFLELQHKGFTPFPKKTKSIEAAVAGATDDTEDVEDDVALAKGVRASDYDYLLSMAIGTLTLEKVQELCADKDKLNQEVDDLRKATPKSLWIKDLDALEQELNEQDVSDAVAEKARKELKNKVRSEVATKPGRQAPKIPRKNTKKANNTVAVTETMGGSTSSAMETDNVPVVTKPKGRAASKKAPSRKEKTTTFDDGGDDDDDDDDIELPELRERLAAYNLESSSDQTAAMDPHVTDATTRKKELSNRVAQKNLPTQSKTLDGDSDEDEVLELKERLAAYNLDSSPDQLADSAAEVPSLQGRKKEPRKRAAAQKKPLVTISESSDGEDQISMDDNEDDDLEVVSAHQAGKKGGKKAAGNAKTSNKPPVATKKRGIATKQPKISQKLLTEMLKPAESSGISPEKKVRKMRASPFNKKSGSLLGRVSQKDKDPEIDESMGSASTTDDTEEVTETLPARARPLREKRRQTTYVVSDSDSEEANEDSDSEEATEDSDFNEDED